LEARSKTKASSTFRHESDQHSGKQYNRAQRAEETLFSRIGLAKPSNGIDQPNPSGYKNLKHSSSEPQTMGTESIKPRLHSTQIFPQYSYQRFCLQILKSAIMVHNFSISQNTMQTFFRVYCDYSLLSPSILTNIQKFASAPSEK
jgi:hypothetical protein